LCTEAASDVKAKTVVIGLLADRIDILDCQGDRVRSSRRVPVSGLTPGSPGSSGSPGTPGSGNSGNAAGAGGSAGTTGNCGKADASAGTAADPRTADPRNADLRGWTKAVRGAAGALREAIQSMGLTGRGAIVLYRSPAESSDYVSVKIAAASQAREAAILGCGDKLGFPVDQAVTEAVVIGRDATGPSGGERQTHLVVAADKDDHASAIVSLVTEAGLKFVSATPIDAAVMAHLGSGALKAAPGGAPGGTQQRAALYIGERRSFFLISHGGTLVFARPVGLGIEAMVTSLTRPLRSFDGSTPIELDTETARTILHRYGFPKREEIVHEAPGGQKITGGQIIPVLQPVLQRFVVELRQSLRFGLSEEERQSVTLQFTGPGSSIPGFASIVSTELGLKVEVDSAYAGYDGVEVGAAGSELLDAIQDGRLLRRLNLPPRALALRTAAIRLRRWLWTGAAASFAMIITDAMHTHTRLADLRHQTESISSQAGEMQAMQVAGQKLMDAIEAMNTMDKILANEVGSAVNYRAALYEISRLTPASVRINTIRFSVTEGKSIGAIDGCAFVDDSTGRLTRLEAFIDSLRESALFEDVSLNNVHMATVQNRNAQSFEVTVVGVPAPVDLIGSVATVSSATEGGRP
jgi:Tfp pilus assembly PilM family ATPase/Tfp pilus assembly protein PilN